jgi:Domain of Unknown Function (DUF748)
VLVVAGVTGMHLAARSVEKSIREALGPEGEAAEIKVGLTGIEIPRRPHQGAQRLADGQHPARSPHRRRPRSARAPVRSGADHAHRCRGRLSLGAAAEGGRRLARPAEHRRTCEEERRCGERAPRRGRGHRPAHRLRHRGVRDATVVGKAQKLRVDAVRGTVEDIRLPELTNRTRIDLAGVSKGVNRSGTVSVRGWVEVANKDAELRTQVRRIDLARFEPYFITKLKSGVDSGSFSLDLRSRVRKNFVTASGTLTVTALKLKPSENPLGAIAGLPRSVAIGALENEQDEITIPFKLEGDLDDQTFSLTGEGTLQTAVAVARAFGTSFEGLVRAFLIIVNGFAGAFRALAPG